ncbi:uncharacterized protein LOC143275676 [Babylonia areolata]|uniref:uncharacterized protein LOC143275676 n=1 Tax=Babylonia areolata TaxID=304850 RepID=UPI003FD11809
MSATNACLVLLVCLAGAAHGFRLRMLNSPPCPADADVKLDTCMTTLQRITTLNLLPENCDEAMEALRCSTMLTRACMDSTEVLNVLSKHDLSALFRVKPICMGQ